MVVNEEPDREGDSAYENWLNGIPEEIRYWRNYIETGGAEYPDDFRFRLRDDTYVDERDGGLAETLEAIPSEEISLLDAGSGPLTNLGKRLRRKKLRLFACDPLADAYGWLLARSGVVPPVPTLFADVENLSMYFHRDSFDGVHCCNALDHSYDPLGGILEMLKVLNPRGFVQLGHFENEAEHERYGGLHQWNFTERDGDFVMWNRTAELSLRQLGAGGLDVWTRRFPTGQGRDWILVHIRKGPGVDRLYDLRRANLPAKYRRLLARTLREKMDGLEPVESGHAAGPGSRGGLSGLSGRIRARLRRML